MLLIFYLRPIVVGRRRVHTAGLNDTSGFPSRWHLCCIRVGYQQVPRCPRVDELAWL
jgi:hypothetical protein